MHGGEGGCSGVGKGAGSVGPSMTAEDVRAGDGGGGGVSEHTGELVNFHMRSACGCGGNATGVGGDDEGVGSLGRSVWARQGPTPSQRRQRGQ